MKKQFFGFIAAALVIASCGDKNEGEVINLASEKDSLSYSIGAMNAKGFTEQGGPDLKKLDFDLVAQGFESNLNDKDASECREVMQKLFGPNFNSFDTTYAKQGAECLGRLAAADFYAQMKEFEQLDKVDMKLVAAGFREGLYGRDTLVKEDAQIALIQKFGNEVMAIQQEKMKKADAPFLADAQKRPNTQVIDGGIIIETIQAGNGGSPAMEDDIEAHYTLTNAKGDTLESSLASGQPLKINLQSVIPGWTMSFPKLKKGGKYRLFIPSDLAYRQGALCFYVELLNYGKAGTIAPPPMNPMQ